MTNYTVLVHEKGKEGFVVAGTSEANTPKQAVEQVLGQNPARFTEGRVGAVPTRSWDPQPFKLVTTPKLELGMSAHWTVYCADCEEYGPDIRRSGGVSLQGLFPRYHPELITMAQEERSPPKLAWATFLDEHEWHKLELHHE